MCMRVPATWPPPLMRTGPGGWCVQCEPGGIRGHCWMKEAQPAWAREGEAGRGEQTHTLTDFPVLLQLTLPTSGGGGKEELP